MVFVNLFRAPLGRAMSYPNAEQLFDRLVKWAAIVARPHVLRRTAATEWIRAGVLRDVVQDLLGQELPASLKPYLHTTDRTAARPSSESRQVHDDRLQRAVRPRRVPCGQPPQPSIGHAPARSAPTVFGPFRTRGRRGRRGRPDASLGPRLAAAEAEGAAYVDPCFRPTLWPGTPFPAAEFKPYPAHGPTASGLSGSPLCDPRERPFRCPRTSICVNSWSLTLQMRPSRNGEVPS